LLTFFSSVTNQSRAQGDFTPKRRKYLDLTKKLIDILDDEYAKEQKY